MLQDTTASPDGAKAATSRQPWRERLVSALHTGERGRLQRAALTAFVLRVASAALLYVSQIVLARWMGAAEFGIYVQVWTWVLILGGLSHLGLSMAMIRLLPAYAATGRTADLRGLLRGGRLVALGVGTLLAGLGLLGLWLYGGELSQPIVWPAYLALACIPMFALTDLQDGIGRGRGWMSAALMPPYVLRPLLLLAVMVLANLARLPMTAVTAMAAAIIGTWVSAAVQFVLVERRLAAELASGPRTYDFARWLRISAPLLAIYASELALQNADVVILSMYRGPQEVGMYFAAAKTMALVMFVHYAVGSAIAHRLSSLHATGERAALLRLVRDGINWTFWPSLAVAVVILLLGKPLLWLFSPHFTDAYPVMLILVLGYLARASTGPAELLLNMLGQQKMCAAVLSATALLNVALSCVLVPRLGMMGAAIGTTAGLTVAAMLNWLVARRRLALDISVFDKAKDR
jgi:O-antigen/teichoic acid export membrane protein